MQAMSLRPLEREDFGYQHVNTNFRLRSPTSHAELREHPSFPTYPFMVPAPFSGNMQYMLDCYSPLSQASHVPRMVANYPIMGSMYQTPPSPALTSQQNLSPARSLTEFCRGDARRQNAARLNRSPCNSGINHHNQVDVSRIREGIDVRTTVRLPKVTS